MQLYYQHSVVSEVEQAVGRARINEPSDQKRRPIIVSNHISEFVTIDSHTRSQGDDQTKQTTRGNTGLHSTITRQWVQAGDITPKLLKELGAGVDTHNRQALQGFNDGVVVINLWEDTFLISNYREGVLQSFPFPWTGDGKWVSAWGRKVCG